MTKAIRAMQEDIKIVDLVIELVDARAPAATRNPEIDRLGKGKARVILLNKADMADPEANAEWTAYYKSCGYECISLDSRKKNELREVNAAIDRACAQKKERDRKRGILNRPVRAMVAGIPNVGKSTLINSIAGKAAARTGNKPGVTKGNQWIRFNSSIELLDTPGITWPKFEDEHTADMIAYIGSINDLIINTSELAESLGNWLIQNKKPLLEKCYGFTGTDYPSLITTICESRSCRKHGNEPDYEKAENILINDFRSGKIGRITLERV